MSSADEAVMSLASSTTPEGSGVDPLQLFATYDFAADAVYQEGLSSILQGLQAAEDPVSDEEKANILRQSKIFYFARLTGHTISAEDAARVEGHLSSVSSMADSGDLSTSSTENSPSSISTSTNPVATEVSTSSEEPRVLSFDELKELILQGKTDQIPNNKHIPEKLNDAPPTQSTAAPPKKPWEVGTSTN